jgi:hypothetical protein
MEYNLHSPGGRGVPDIALQSSNYQMASEGEGYAASGASCSKIVRL